MKLFISYSREDEAIALLLAYILDKRKDIECLHDRQLPFAKRFDLELRKLIERTDMVLVILTDAATSSSWVNQEIGFALAMRKPIFPVAMKEKVEPKGLISTTNTYSLFDWSAPKKSIERLVASLRQQQLPGKDRHRVFGLPQVLQGKIARTEFLVHTLGRLKKRPAEKLTIYNQAAFSIFCASDHPLYREAGQHSEEYMRLLLEEKRILEELVEQGAHLKLILWPVRAYEPKYLSIRYENLLQWMKKQAENRGVAYVLAQYPGPNRYIVESEFCLEGYKLHHTSGYGMSIAHYDDNRIAMALGEFNATFSKPDKDKSATITQIERMHKRATQLPGTQA